MNALLFCGIRQHRRVPQVRSFRAEENPVDALLQTWAATPREQVLRLAERIETGHFDGSAPSKMLTNVVRTVAGTLADTSVPVEERHRLAPLCAAVDAHVADMTAQEALGTMEALQQMGVLTGNKVTYELLLRQLWRDRDELSVEQRQRCFRVLQQVKGAIAVDVAEELYQFVVSH
ncbi:hypothetical protein STCU_10746 [Strigomonas culicis]|nr:hypothetical protein STCU_10746 [Strigomonas culicis]|eukprot:EPY17232.1 hypothetical protein STCU_10746 [Strigomonas culicis]